MKNLITKFSYLLLFLLIGSKSLALETEIIRDLDKWREKIAVLDWKNFEENEFRVSVSDLNGSIKIDKEEIFLEGDDINQYSYWTWGTPDSSQMFIKHTNGNQLFIFFPIHHYLLFLFYKLHTIIYPLYLLYFLIYYYNDLYSY